MQNAGSQKKNSLHQPRHRFVTKRQEINLQVLTGCSEESSVQDLVLSVSQEKEDQVLGLAKVGIETGRSPFYEIVVVTVGPGCVLGCSHSLICIEFNPDNHPDWFMCLFAV